MKSKSSNQNGRKWLNRNVAAMGFTSLFSDASHEMATSILAQFLTVELHGSAEILGLIEGLADFSSSFIKTYSGWLSDKLGRRKPLATLGYMLTGIFISLFAFASNFLQVLFYRTVGWIGRGVREPPRDALLADSVEPESYGHAFGFHRMMDTLGAIIGPSIAFILLPLIGFRNVFLAALLPGILAISVFALFTREKVCRQKVKEERKLLGDIRGLPAKFKHYLLAVGIFGVGNFANTFLVLKATEALTPSLGAIVASSISAFLYVLLNVGAAVFAYIFGALGDKFSKKNLLALGYLIFSIYCIGFILLPPNIWIYAFLFLLAGAETGAIDATERSYAAELLEENRRGTGFGILSTINGIGDFTSSITAGILWTLISASASFAFGATLALAATAILITRK
ncbi:MAG: MFS transporter [Candidatus Bathyarchaeia archaeon]